jgi:hypothetical protein
MAESKLSGYKATAAAITWTSGQGVNSLTDNEWTDLSDEIDNSTNLYMLADLYLDLGSAAFTGTDSSIEIYLIPTVDGSTYPNWTGNVTTDEQENNQYYVGEVYTSGATATQDIVIRNILLPNGKYKWGFRNRSNVTLNATNAIYWRPHQYQAV